MNYELIEKEELISLLLEHRKELKKRYTYSIDIIINRLIDSLQKLKRAQAKKFLDCLEYKTLLLLVATRL